MEIKKYRLAAKLSQLELATRVGVTQGAITQWEQGKTSPNAGRLEQIADVLGCTINDLFGGGSDVAISERPRAAFERKLQKSTQPHVVRTENRVRREAALRKSRRSPKVV